MQFIKLSCGYFNYKTKIEDIVLDDRYNTNEGGKRMIEYVGYETHQKKPHGHRW